MNTKYEIRESVEVKVEGTITDIEKSDKKNLYLIELGNGCKIWSSEDYINYVENDKTYEDGLNEIWKFMQDISDVDDITYSKIFGDNRTKTLFQRYTPKEALLKYEEYKLKQAFHVGDEVLSLLNNRIAVITHIDKMPSYDVIYILYSDGTVDKVYDTKQLKKTGRFYNIKEYFEKMSTYKN